jgi:urease accessory protein
MLADPASALALLMLADGRFPAGGHAHSLGVESAVMGGRVRDESTLEELVLARLLSNGLVDAALAAATVRRLSRTAVTAEAPAVLGMLDDEAEARIVPVALRALSRRQGRQLARAASRCWPSAELAVLADRFPGGAHQSVAVGCVGVAVAATPRQVAELVVHHAMSTPAQAGLRLLGLDPYAVAALVARLAPSALAVVDEAVAASEGPVAGLPAVTVPLLDIAATDHAAWTIRHFAS